MIDTCIDAEFGEMKYKHKWFKEQSISLFGKKWNIIISAMSYLGKPINEAERQAYRKYMENESDYSYTIAEQLKMYINNNLYNISEYWAEAHKIEKPSDLVKVVIPRSLVFQQDGTTIMMLDCIWDSEHGIAVEVIPEVKTGSQDYFL
jgi:hypothetical protein